MTTRWIAFRLGSALLVVVAMVLVGMGLLESRSDDQGRRHGLRIEARSLSFGEVYKGQEFFVSLPVKNDSSEEIQILGSTKLCTPEGCLEALGLPVPIAPGATISVEVGGTGTAAGLFHAEIVLYTSCAGTPEVPLQVVGRIIDADR